MKRACFGLAALAVLCSTAGARAQPAPAAPGDGSGSPPPDAAAPAPTTTTPATTPPAPAAAPAPAPADEAPAADRLPEPVPVEVPAVVPAAPAAPGVDVGGFRVTVGGYVQPQVRFRQNDPTVQGDEDGFRVRRARLDVKGRGKTGDVDVGVATEVELAGTNAQLYDAYVTAAARLGGSGRWEVAAGQLKVPFSRQELLSDAALSFVDKPELASLAPDRQIGARLTLEVPGAPWVKLAGGAFNGEGRNQIQNIDEHIMWVGRAEVSPFGHGKPLEESAFEGTYLTFGASVARNYVLASNLEEHQLYLGADVAGAWHGLSGTVEYLEVRHRFFGPDPMSVPPDYKGNGVVAQAAYLLPLPGKLADHVEVAGRFEEIDRNDTIQITVKGDPNQSLRYYTIGLSWYEWKHALKLQATASHIVELEDRDRSGNDATYPNDTILIQATYRLE